MTDPLESVKTLASNYRRGAKESEAENEHLKAQRQLKSADALTSVIEELEAARKRLRALPNTYGDLSDLPEEVLAELSLTKVDELEQQLRDIVASANGGEVGLDAIIIELYRRHKVIQPRRFIMNKLYRMAQKELIYSVEGRKGVYYVPRAGRPQPAAFDTDLDDDVPF